MNLLEEIVLHKKSEVARRKRQVPVVELLEQARRRADVRPFFQRIAGEAGFHLICEFKRRSPSKGDIRPEANPAETARRYERAGASALSVLTDGRYFGGSLQDLQTARQATNLPVLRKDFIVDEYQIAEAAAAGADAVLLIARILSK